MFNFNRKENGQGLVEYALILVLIAIVVIVAMTTLGDKVSGTFDSVNSELGGNGGGQAQQATAAPTAVPTATVDPYATSMGSTRIYDGGFGDNAKAHFCPGKPSGIPFIIWDVGSGWSIAGGSATTVSDAMPYDVTGGTQDPYIRTTGTCS